MIIKDRKSRDETYEESSWRRFETKMRVWLYTLMHELTRSQHFSVVLYRLLLFIEACQFVWYAWHPRLDFLWDSSIFEGIQTVLKFCQIDKFLQDEGQGVTLSILYVTFGLLVAMMGIGGIGIAFISKVNYQADSAVLNYSLKALNLYNFLLSTILAFPFYFICITIFGCSNQNPLNQDLNCFEGIYFLHLVVAIVSFIILISTSLLLTFLSVDLNPWSKSPFAAPKSRVNLVKMLLKIIVCIYYVLDYKGEYVKQYIAIYCVLWILILIMRYIQTPLYNRSIFNYILGVESCVVWITLSSVFVAFVDSPPADNISLLFIVLLIIPWAITVVVVFNMRRDALLKADHKTLKRQIDCELYILNAVELIEHRDDLEQRMTLEGMLKLHIKSCAKSSEECPCRLIAQNYFKEEEAPEKMWYTWLQSILDDLVSRFTKSASLHILYACMAREKLENKYKSLFELMAAQNSDPSIEEQFTMYRYRNTIQQDMIDVDLKINRNKINVNLIVEFQSKFLKFQTAIEAAVELHLEFWRELMENSPEVQKLQSLGARITTSVVETASQYKKLALLNSNQIRMLQIYGNFLKDIVNDDIEGGRVIERATHVTKSGKLDKETLDKIQLKYGENSDTCLITCSGNTYNLGKILRANNEITRILKYTKEEVEGANVNFIMPKVIGDLHDDFMRNYLATSVAKTIDRETVAFPVNKNGYLVPCTLMVKVLPNLHAGIRFVGFMQGIDEGDELNQELISARNSQSDLKRKGTESDQKNTRQKYYIMYDGRSGQVYGVTASCRRDFGISAKLANSINAGREGFTIDSILPDLLNCNIDLLKRSEGQNLTIDTSELKEKFLFSNDDSDDEEVEGEVKYQTKTVNVTLIQDDEYPTAHLRVIRLMDVKDIDDEYQEINIDPDMTALKKSAQKDRSARSDDSPSEVTKKQTIGVHEEGEKSQVEGADGLEEVEGVGSDLSSGQAEVNEEIRLIRDFKALISKSSTPRSIIIIRNIAILMALALIALISFGLSVKFSQVNEYREGITTITDNFQRLNYIADLNFNLRRLQLVAGGFITMTTDEVAALRATVLSSVGNLRDNNIQIDNHQEDLASKGVRSVESETIVIESLLQSGPKIDTGSSFSNALSQYISHATAAANADLSAFFSTDTRISTKASFFFVRRNGLGPLRQKSTDNADVFFDYYWNNTSSFDNKLKVVLIIAIIVLVIALIPIMFIIFSVHKTATSILSLFMFIQPQEVKELARKCQAFMETFLEERKRNIDLSFGEEDQHRKKAAKVVDEHSYIQIQPSEDESRLKHPEASDNRILGEGGMSASTNRLLTTENRPLGLRSKRVGSYIAGERMDTEDILLRTEGNETTERPLALRENTVKELEETKKKLGDAKKSAHEEQAEIDANRAAAFMNSRDEYKGKIILHFVLITMVFVAYFLADFLDNRSAIDQIKTGLVHLRLRNQRMAGLKFVNTFTLEELAEGSEYPVYNYTYQPYTNIRNMYRTSILGVMQALAKNRRQDFSSDFNSYLKNYDIATNEDLCANYYNNDSATLDECDNAGGGLLKEGSTIAITRIEQTSQDVIKEFNQTQRSTGDQTNSINSAKFEQSTELMDYMNPVWKNLFAQFIENFKDYLDQRNTMDRIKFAVFILMMFFMLLFVWIPYKLILNDKIFRAKGMLKMIPIEMITKDENLKQTFFSGNILQAVK